VLLPWSATAMMERCAEDFLALPVEIHLGPEQILTVRHCAGPSLSTPDFLNEKRERRDCIGG
jgi:hypothetical protein